MVLVQEPNSHGEKLVGLPASFRCVYNSTQPHVWTAVIMVNPAVNVLQTVFVERYFAVARLRLGSLELLAVLAYFQFSIDTQSLADCLCTIVYSIGADWHIIGADANGHSPLWFSHDWNQQGEIVEDLISKLGLSVVNILSKLTTYAASTGESNGLTWARSHCFGLDCPQHYNVKSLSDCI